MNATNSPVLTPVWAAAPDHDLVVDGTPVAPLWVASTRDERNTGLLGTDGLPEGAVWIERCGNVHTVGMRYPIDVVFLSRGGRVASVAALAPLPAPRRAHCARDWRPVVNATG